MITQHIGAYLVECKGETITFLDNRRHKAFPQMRVRGAMGTDIFVLLIATVDGIMSKTVVAIKHQKMQK